MKEIEKLLSLIPREEIVAGTVQSYELSFDAALEELDKLHKDNPGSLTRAFLSIIVRTVELYLLADTQILDVARQPAIYAGREDEEIARRLDELTGCAPEPVVRYLVKCVTGFSARRSAKSPLPLWQVERLFLSEVSSRNRRELRCSICGYHFRAVDLGTERRRLAEGVGATLASSLEPGRITDVMRPTALTGLEVDHIVPESGFGWTDIDNLRVTCVFCNQGRMNYRRALEPLSIFIAGSLCMVPETPQAAGVRQAGCVAAIIASGRRCGVCGATIEDVELTVRLRPQAERSRLWFVPWNVRVVCYRCAADELGLE